MRLTCLLLALVLATGAWASQQERWDKDVGKPAPELVAAGWMGTPISLESIKGNTIVLGFWNADVPC